MENLSTDIAHQKKKQEAHSDKIQTGKSHEVCARLSEGLKALGQSDKETEYPKNGKRLDEI